MRGPGNNTAEHPTWGECVGEIAMCDENGMCGRPGRQFLCTGGTHTGPGEYVRCISEYHYKDGPMSPGIGFLPAE